MPRVSLRDVLGDQEVVVNVAALPGDVAGKVKVPISELQRLSRWPAVQWDNVMLTYGKQLVMSSQSKYIMLDERSRFTPQLCLWQLHEALAGSAVESVSVDPPSAESVRQLLDDSGPQGELAVCLAECGVLSVMPLGDPMLETRPAAPPGGVGVGGGAAANALAPAAAAAPPRNAALMEFLSAVVDAVQPRLLAKMAFFLLICGQNRMMKGEKKVVIAALSAAFYLHQVGALGYVWRMLMKMLGVDEHRDNVRGGQQQQEEVAQQAPAAAPAAGAPEGVWEALQQLSHGGVVLPRAPGLAADMASLLLSFVASLFPEWQIPLPPPADPAAAPAEPAAGGAGGGAVEPIG